MKKLNKKLMNKTEPVNGVGIRVEFVFVGEVRSIDTVINEEGLKDKESREIVLTSLKEAANELLTKHYGNA